MNRGAESSTMVLSRRHKKIVLVEDQYELMASTILALLFKHEELWLNDLVDQVKLELSNKFKGNIVWYLLHVKSDLESRGIIRTLFIGKFFPVVRINY